MSRNSQNWFPILLTLLLILPFQNCGQGFKLANSNSEDSARLPSSEEYCSTEPAPIASLQAQGVNAQRVEFCNFRKLTDPTSKVTFGNANEYILNSDFSIIRPAKGLYLFDSKDDSYKSIYDAKENQTIVQVFPFPTLFKVALIISTIDAQTNQANKKVEVIDLENMKTLLTSKTLSSVPNYPCSYVANKEYAGKMICGYPNSSNPKLIQAGVVDVKNLSELILPHPNDNFQYKYTWTSTEALQSYSGFFTFDNSNQIIMRLNKLDENNKEVFFIINESIAEMIDESKSYDFYGDGNLKTFTQFKSDYAATFFGISSDENTKCNGIEYKSKMSFNYFNTGFNYTRSRLICNENVAIFMNTQNDIEKCTDLNSCTVFDLVELGVPFNLGTRPFYNKKNNSIYSFAASFKGNFYTRFFEKLSLENSQHNPIKFPQQPFSYTANAIFQGGSSWRSDEVRMLDGLAVSGIDVFDNEANRFLRLPPLKLSLAGNLIFRERRSLSSKRYFIGQAMGIKDKTIVATSDSEIIEIEGNWIRNSDTLDESKNNPIIYLTTNLGSNLVSYNLLTKEKITIYQASEGESINAYAQMAKYVALVSYKVINGGGSSLLTVFDLNQNKVVFKKTSNQSGSSLEMAKLLNGFFFSGTVDDGSGTGMNISKLYKFNVVTGVASEREIKCRMNYSECNLSISTNEDAGYIETSNGIIFDAELNLLSDTNKGDRFYHQPIQKQIEYFLKYDPVTKIKSIIGFNYNSKQELILDTSQTGFYQMAGSMFYHIYQSDPKNEVYDKLELLKNGKLIKFDNYKNQSQSENYLLVGTGTLRADKYYLYDTITLEKKREWSIKEKLSPSFIGEKLIQWQYQKNGQNLLFIEKL